MFRSNGFVRTAALAVAVGFGFLLGRLTGTDSNSGRILSPGAPGAPGNPAVSSNLAVRKGWESGVQAQPVNVLEAEPVRFKAMRVAAKVNGHEAKQLLLDAMPAARAESGQPDPVGPFGFIRTEPFKTFRQWKGSVRPGMNRLHESLFLGIQTNCTFYHGPDWQCASPNEQPRTHQAPPTQDDHFFEWSDMIAAMLEARPRGRFSMLELGAGWAKWVVDAVFLAQQLGFPRANVVAIGVEAQPSHCQMARWHIAANRADPWATGSPPAEPQMMCCAVGAADGELEFPIDDSAARGTGTGKFGYGAQMILDGKRWGKVMKIKAMGMCSLVGDSRFRREPVDFVSLDVQSSEHAILNEDAITCMDVKVRIVHISLHRVEENDARVLAQRFTTHGWRLIRYNPLFSSGVQTAVGPVSFTDGRLTFINPKLTPDAMYTALYDPKNIHKGSYTEHKNKAQSSVPDWGPGDTILEIVAGK